MRMTVLLFDGFTALDVVGGYEVLANVPGVEVEFAAVTPGVVATDTPAGSASSPTEGSMMWPRPTSSTSPAAPG